MNRGEIAGAFRSYDEAMSSRILCAAIAGLVSLAPRAIDACSCVPPSAQLFSPGDVEAAPTNSRVTVAVPHSAQTADLVVRPVGGPAVAVSVERHPTGSLDVIVLSPTQPLPPNTRFEVALVNQEGHPRTFVFGTFATGSERDDTAPTLEPIGNPVFHDTIVMAGTSCASPERFIEVPLGKAIDPKRPEAPILYGIWLLEGGAKIDPKSQPHFVLGAHEGTLTIGARSMCTWLDPVLPSGPRNMRLGIVAIDEAGHRSALQERRLTVPAGKTP